MSAEPRSDDLLLRAGVVSDPLSTLEAQQNSRGRDRKA